MRFDSMIAEHFSKGNAAHTPRDVGVCASGNHHAGITRRDSAQKLACRFAHPGAARTRDDRRKRSVVIERDEHIPPGELGNRAFAGCGENCTHDSYLSPLDPRNSSRLWGMETRAPVLYL